MATRMQQRRGTASQWASANPILAVGEIGFATDTFQFKIGDGVKTWTQLENAYVNAAGGDVIIPSAPGVVPLGIQAVTGQTAQLFQIKNSAGTVVAYIDVNGDYWQDGSKILTETSGFSKTLIDAAGDLVVGTGPDAAGRLARGSAGQNLRVNLAGTALEYYSVAADVLPTKQVFTASGTWTKPSGATLVEIYCFAGGGGGGFGLDSASAGAGGGGGGAIHMLLLASEVPSTVTATVGAGGNAATSTVAATQGGSTSFGSIVSVSGGSPGASQTGNTALGGDGGLTSGDNGNGGGGSTPVPAGSAIFGGGGGGGGTSASTAIVAIGGHSIFGGGGGAGGSYSIGQTVPYGGGTSIFGGAGGSGGLPATAAMNGKIPGGGGGGGANTAVAGAGARGEVVVITYT